MLASNNLANQLFTHAVLWAGLLLLTIYAKPTLGETSEELCSEQSPCTLGVFPHAAYRQMEATYAPLAEDLSLLTDLHFEFATASSLPRFGAKLASGDYEIALIGSPQLLTQARLSGFTPVARRAQERVFSWVVRSDSPYRTLQSLAGQRIGRAASNTATDLVAMHLLMEAGLTRQQLESSQAFGRQQGCVHALLTDLIDACAMANAVLEQVYINYGEQHFRVLATSKPYPNVIYVAHKKLSTEAIDEIQDYLSSRPGFTTANESDYHAFDGLHPQP